MGADKEEPPNPRGAGLRRALCAFIAFISRFLTVACISRFFKYVVLLFGVTLTLIVVFDAYSFYIARRDIDSELRSKKVPSLEYLNLMLQRERALTVTALEGRCAERVQLTMFRIFNAEDDQIQKIYSDLVEEKNGLIKIVEKLGPS